MTYYYYNIRRLARLALAMLILIALCSCLNIREVDRRTKKPVTVLHVSANVSHLEFTSANGSHLVMDNFEPDKTHKAISDGVSKGLLSGGTAFGPLFSKLIKP